MTLVVRDDLTHRLALSKSEVTQRFWCGIASFYSRTMPRPWQPSPEMVFGSAMDAAIEQVVRAVASDRPVTNAIEAAAEVAERDGIEVDLDEVKHGIVGFVKDVVPLFEWHGALPQQTIRADIEGIGPVEGHPDLILADGTVLDVKASRYGKKPEDIWAKPEFPIYAALMDASGARPKRVGYLTWQRGLARPKWQVPPVMLDVDDDLVAEGRLELLRQSRLRRLYDQLATSDSDPSEYLDGPRFVDKCRDCVYADVCTTGQRRLRRLQEVA